MSSSPKIVLAFDSFKGCMTATEACHAAAAGLLRAHPDAEILELPLSDGGEGLVESLSQFLPLHLVHFAAHDPLMRPINATYAISEDGLTAYMEMAATSGLTLVPPEFRNPLHTTTYGVGEMLLDAAHRGCQSVVIGLGGSATCDGGRGMLQALQDAGYCQPHALPNTSAPAGAQHPSLPHIRIASDVTNPLYGPNGAAYIFAPQKGATPDQVRLLDAELRQFARETAEQGIAPLALADHPGAGAAGGLGYALMAYLGAELCSGIDLVLDLLDFDRRIAGADWVITGEGQSDAQTLMGKLPEGVLRRCHAQNIPVWLLSGSIVDPDHVLAAAFDRVSSINDGDSRPLPTLLQPSVARANMTRAVTAFLPSFF